MIFKKFSFKSTIVKGMALCMLMSIQNQEAEAQGNVPCDGSLYFTRQISPSTRISKVNIDSLGEVSVPDAFVLSPNKSTNSTVYFNGYIFTQDWSPSAFTLLRVNVDGSHTSAVVTGMPSGVDYNNAGIDKNGVMYIVGTQAAPVLYKIDLNDWPTITAETVVCSMTSGTRLWGDIAFDPITDKAYAWYHPSATPAAAEAQRGLYEIVGYNTSSPSFVKVGEPTNHVLGTLFFTERGQLYGYGVDLGNPGGTDQRYFYFVDLTPGTTLGQVIQLAESETSSQSDGCECAYRLSLTLTAGASGNIDIPTCSNPSSFQFNLNANNTTPIDFEGITFEFALDPRFSFADSEATLETEFSALFGSAVDVIISNDDGGLSNKINITGMKIEPGITPFTLSVNILNASEDITDGEIIGFQSQFGGLADYYGTQEPSSDPLSLFGKNASLVTFNKNSDLCATVSGSVFNDPNADDVNNSTGVDNLIPTGIFANLIDVDGNVFQSIMINTDGTYSFSDIPSGSYHIQLSSSLGEKGSVPPSYSVNDGWSNTGAYIGIPNSGNTEDTNGLSTSFTILVGDNLSDVNFGIQQLPETVVNVISDTGGYIAGASLLVPPTSFINATEIGDPNTEDYSGGEVIKIRFTTFPFGIDSVEIDGVIYTSTTFPTQGVTVPYSSTTGITGINVYPVSGVSTIVIPIASIDDANTEDPTPGSITMNLSKPLPISIINFSGIASNCEAIISWELELNNEKSIIALEESDNGLYFKTILLSTTTENADKNTVKLDFESVGSKFYRLAIENEGGKKEYSRIIKVESDCNTIYSSIYPNPASNNIRIHTGYNNPTTITISNIEGKVLKTITNYLSNDIINISDLPKGVLFIDVLFENENQTLKLIKH